VLKALSFRSATAVPSEHRRNFNHFYLDISWFGILNSSSIAFAAIFATRQGASSLQIGLLNAAPALVALLFALPIGRWLTGKPVSRIVFWSALIHRLPYLVWIFLPWLFRPSTQVLALLLLVLVMSIPGTVLAISFNGLFAAGVPVDWRGHVAGIRNALYAVVSFLVSLLCSFILDRAAFPQGYQIIFALGFVGAVLSTVHLWFIRPSTETPALRADSKATSDIAQPGMLRLWSGQWRSVGWRYMMSNSIKLRDGVLADGRFRTTLTLIFLFHVGLYLANPLFPIYLVKELHLADKWYSIGNGLFYVSLFFGSMQLARLTRKWGNHITLAIGVMLTCLYPLLISQSTTVLLFYIASLAGGLAWAIAGGAMGNYILDQIPDEARPSYLAWYNLAVQAAVLTGSLSAPFIGDWIGLVPALLLGAGVRLLSGILIWRKG
jgi:MFS family permease